MLSPFQEIVGADGDALVADAEIGIKKLKRSLSFAKGVAPALAVVVVVVVGKGVWVGISLTKGTVSQPKVRTSR
jgi:hypothetical protein